MNGINRVFLVGYLGSTPELQVSKNGKTYARLNLATHYNKRLDNGDRQESTVWHKVQVWGKNAERCHAYLQKGAALAVEGYLSKYSYEKEDGSQATETTVVAREIHFISGKGTKKKDFDADGSEADQIEESADLFAPNP